MKKVIMSLGPKGILALLIIFLTTVFAFQNYQPITIKFFFWKLVEIPKLYLVLISTLQGMILGILLTLKFKKRFK